MGLNFILMGYTEHKNCPCFFVIFDLVSKTSLNVFWNQMLSKK